MTFATPQTKQITLEKGIKLGDNLITNISITKPLVGHLKGISIKNLIEMQTDEIAKLIPRVTQPSIPQHALDGMDFGEFLSLAGEVMGFLMGADDTATPDE